VLDKVLIYIAKTVFYVYAFIWLLKRRRVGSVGEVLNIFYLDFLRIKRGDVEVLRINRYEVVTKCRNPCPILTLAMRLRLDTRYVCKEVSEPVCRYVLRRLNPNLVFERDYSSIRPYSDGCVERISIKV
jgi:hypothetical protein